MSADKRKTEPPFRLDMDFEEALKRFLQTSPSEVNESVERAKQKKPPGDDVPRRPKGAARRSNPSEKS